MTLVHSGPQRVLALVLAPLGAAPLVLGALILVSPPDGDGVGGLEWAPIAVPMILLGIAMLATAWRYRRPPRP